MKIEKSVTEILSLLEESNPNGKFERVPVFFGVESIIGGNIPISELIIPKDFCHCGNRIKEANSDKLAGFLYQQTEY